MTSHTNPPGAVEAPSSPSPADAGGAVSVAGPPAGEEFGGIEFLRPHPRIADDASVSYRAKHIRALFAEIERVAGERDNARHLLRKEPKWSGTSRARMGMSAGSRT